MRIALVALLVAAAPAAGSGTWKRAPSMLHTRSAHAVVTSGAAVYALGGSGTNGPVRAVERFDGRRWRNEATLPEGLNAPAAVFLDGRIYVIGGFEGLTNLPTSAVRVYDTSTRQWSDAAPLPAPRGGHAAVVLDGKIHVVGGGNSESTIADHSVYDPATNRWTDAAPLPRSEGSPAAVVWNDKLYAIGGRSGFSDFGDVYIYDAATNSWTTGPPIPPRGTAGAVVYRDAIYLFGGESQRRGTTLRDVLRLGPASSAWKRVSRMPTARNYARAVVFHDAVYVVGGSRYAGASHSAAGSKIVERYFVRK